jgi:DNA-binding winged helix-turn-helix (wHTH) protein/Tol biopolymer transport system component
MASKSLVFRFGDVEVREREFSLIKAGEVLPVEPKAFRVLLILLQNPQKLISKEELLNAVWGEVAVGDNSLARSVALLRRLLGDDTRNPRYIETVATVGYRLVCTVESVEDPAGVAAAPDPATARRSGETANAESTLTRRPEGVTRKARGRKWMLAVGTGALALLTMGIWYLRRPLPPPRITTYTPITHDGRDKSVGAIDGSRLYFTQRSPNLVAQVGVNGGEVARLPIAIPGASIFLSDLSPDGSTALIEDYENGSPFGGDNFSNRPLDSRWIVPILGGAARRLPDGIGGTYSPDGSSVIYSTLAGDIFIVRTDGTGKDKLASVGSGARGFRWSPDGKVIRFSKGGLLWEMSSDGTGIRRLLSDWKERGVQCCGRWTRDGRFYVFLAGRRIWALDNRRGLFHLPSSVPIQLTSEPIRWGPPIPAADGKTIFVDGKTLRGELSRIDLKTGNPQPFLGGISAEFVSFSPDGNFVAYVAFPEGTLWKATCDGGNRMQLTQPPDYVINPRWSPDSKEIVFTAVSRDGNDSLRRISAENGTRLWVMPEESSQMSDPNWSPDGRKVVFAKSNGRVYSTGVDLRIVDLETRQVTILSGSDHMLSPRWSPDGRYVVAFSDADIGLHLFDFTTHQWHTLPVTYGGVPEFPSFSRDSRFIYFVRRGREQGVFRIPVEGEKEERLVDMTDWRLTGYWVYSLSLDPTDAPLVLRDTGSDDIYALTLEEK